MSSAIEAMPAERTGVVIGPCHRAKPIGFCPRCLHGIEVRWIDSQEELIAAVEGLEWRAGTPQVFAHGERETIKVIRKILKDREVPRESLSISAYWAQGRAEDQFQAEKREPIGQID